jgi:hypothetical protein
MVRPRYETGVDVANELVTTDFLSEKWRCTFKKLPIKYELDFVLESGGKCVAFAELKTRTYSRQQIANFGGQMISLAKFCTAKNTSENTGLPVLIIVRCTDQLIYMSIDSVESPAIQWAGRNDRNDPLDHEPYVMLPDNLFKAID